MGERTIEKPRTAPDAGGDAGGDASAGEAAPRGPGAHPLDTWLRSELRGLCPGSAEEPLPPGIAALADRLEARLGEAKDRPAPRAGRRRR